MKNYFGINVGKHDSSVCHVTIGSEISVTVYEEERYARKKHKGLFPYAAVGRMLEEVAVGSVSPGQVGATNFMETLEEGYVHTSKKHFFEDFLKIKKCELLTDRNPLLKKITHHEAHLFSVLPQISEASALVVVADSCGSPLEWARSQAIFPFPRSSNGDIGHENVSVYLKTGASITCLKKIPTYHLVNATCDAAIASEVYCKTANFVFGSWEHCGKLMGLAAFHQGPLLEEGELLKALDDMPYEPARTKADFDQLSEERFKFFACLAASAQKYFEEWFLALFADLKQEFSVPPTLYFLGGSALNCLLNTRMQVEKTFDDVKCIAYPNDEGASIGAAIAAAYQNGDYVVGQQSMNPTAFLGSSHSLKAAPVLHEKSLYSEKVANYAEMAQLLLEGEVVAWVFGRSECGPRALGHRSLLASAFVPGIKQKMNQEFKQRESFRPYGVSILAEDVADYFAVSDNFRSPFMSFTPQVRSTQTGLLKEVLQPDGSLRVQTVTLMEPELRELLLEFKKISGHGILLHTSLNSMGQPIIETTSDLMSFMEQGPVEHWVINNVYVKKQRV